MVYFSVRDLVPKHDAAVATGCDKGGWLGWVEMDVVDAVDVGGGGGGSVVCCGCAVTTEFEVDFADLGIYNVSLIRNFSFL